MACEFFIIFLKKIVAKGFFYDILDERDERMKMQQSHETHFLMVSFDV